MSAAWAQFASVAAVVLLAAAIIITAVVLRAYRVRRDMSPHAQQARVMDMVVEILTLWDELHEQSIVIQHELIDITRECAVMGPGNWHASEEDGGTNVQLDATIATLRSTVTMFRSLDHTIRSLCKTTLKWLNADSKQAHMLHSEMVRLADASVKLVAIVRSQLSDYVGEVHALAQERLPEAERRQVHRSLRKMSPLLLGMELTEKLRHFFRITFIESS